MKLYSTWYYDEKINHELSFEILDRELKRAESVTIVSAYYSIKFIERTLLKVNKSKRSKCEIVLVFNGLAGQRLYDQIDDLGKLKLSLLESKFSRVHIFLNRQTALFHTKLYFIKNDTGTKWFAGSANASISAFERNEEILFESNKNIRNIRKYVNDVVQDSELIENIDSDDLQSNLIGFFRTGSIYFKPNSQISFTFSEFKLPDLIEERLSNVNLRPRNTNPGKAWGAYNLKRSLGFQESEYKEDKQNLSIKPWSIETCYGYWVPNRYREAVESDIKKKSAKKESELKKIASEIENKGVDYLVAEFGEYLKEVNSILDENIIEFKIEHKKLSASYERFVIKTLNKLNDPKQLRKLSVPYISAGMPEIWEDKFAFTDFTESFYDYISVCLTGRTPRIINSIKDHIDIDSSFDSEEIESRFVEFFDSDDGEWSEDNWR